MTCEPGFAAHAGVVLSAGVAVGIPGSGCWYPLLQCDENPCAVPLSSFIIKTHYQLCKKEQSLFAVCKLGDHGQIAFSKALLRQSKCQGAGMV